MWPSQRTPAREPRPVSRLPCVSFAIISCLPTTDAHPYLLTHLNPNMHCAPWHKTTITAAQQRDASDAVLHHDSFRSRTQLRALVAPTLRRTDTPRCLPLSTAHCAAREVQKLPILYRPPRSLRRAELQKLPIRAGQCGGVVMLVNLLTDSWGESEPPHHDKQAKNCVSNTFFK